jgi:hypothetical protein
VSAHLGLDFKTQHPFWTAGLVAFVPGAIATAASHPADLMTGLLNGDPRREKFKTSSAAFNDLMKSRGLRGLSTAYPARLVAFTIECNFFGAVFSVLSNF